MFDANDTKRARAILDNFGATHFTLMPDGELHAVVGTQTFRVEGENLLFDLSDSEKAAMHTDEAIKKASGG